MKDSWSHSVNIPHDLAGPPLTSEKVSLFKILFQSGSWARENEKHHKLFFWDPDKMHLWVKRKITEKHSGYDIKKVGQSMGIIVDKSQYPVTHGPIWLQQLNPKNPKETLRP
jgi:hypothetical protein